MLGESTERVGEMTPGMRRSVVMSLLSCIGPGGRTLSSMPPSRIRSLAFAAWFNSDSNGGYDADCLEAAYRLIEKSQKLRKEWFGR